MGDWLWGQLGLVLMRGAMLFSVQSSSVVQSYPTVCNPMDCSTPGFPIHHQLLELAQTHVHRVSWCHPTILSSVIPFSSYLQSFPASGSFPVSQFFASGGQSIGALVSGSVFPVNIQDWFPLGLTGLILESKGLSRVFSNNTVLKRQFFGTQLSLWFNTHMRTWPLEKTIAVTRQTFVCKAMSLFLICCLGLSQFFFQGASEF